MRNSLPRFMAPLCKLGCWYRIEPDGSQPISNQFQTNSNQFENWLKILRWFCFCFSFAAAIEKMSPAAHFLWPFILNLIDVNFNIFENLKKELCWNNCELHFGVTFGSIAIFSKVVLIVWKNHQGWENNGNEENERKVDECAADVNRDNTWHYKAQGQTTKRLL